jgi:hypothetical protein
MLSGKKVEIIYTSRPLAMKIQLVALSLVEWLFCKET